MILREQVVHSHGLISFLLLTKFSVHFRDVGRKLPVICLHLQPLIFADFFLVTNHGPQVDFGGCDSSGCSFRDRVR